MDIVKRLRSKWRKQGCKPPEMDEAADEIETLRQRETAFKSKADFWEVESKRLASETDKNVSDLSEYVYELEKKIATANAELRRWEEYNQTRTNELLAATQQLALTELSNKKLREAYVLLENFAQSVGGSSSFWEDFAEKLDEASCIANFNTPCTEEHLRVWMMGQIEVVAWMNPMNMVVMDHKRKINNEDRYSNFNVPLYALKGEA